MTIHIVALLLHWAKMGSSESKRPEAQASLYNEATALLPKLTQKQKVRLVSGASMWTLKPVKSLGLPKIWLSDGPHGLRKQNHEWVTDLLSGRLEATCFPTASCLACCWDPSLLEQIGQVLGRECRANGVSVLLGPGINIMRHPCGGRNFEYYSEDPFLTGRMAGALVNGVQSQGVGVSLKHFLCNNQETWRFVLDVIVDERTQRELYEAAFEYVIKESQPWTVMCAYNQVNGVFGSENPIFTRIREEWNFQGLVMTDWGATNNRVKGIQAGVDLEMPGSVGACDDYIMNALARGELLEADLDKCVVRVLSLMLLSKEQLEQSHEDSERGNVSSLDAHHELAREAAMQSVVLLKNDQDILPLGRDVSVAVIGAFAKEPRFQGMGSSEVNAYKVDCAWDRIQDYTSKARYAPGYPRHNYKSAGDQTMIDEAVQIAQSADVALVFCGLTEICESEGFDRVTMELSPAHTALLNAVAKVNPKTIVVLSNGSAVTMPWVKDVSGIVESWLGGQAGASATVDLIFGQASPSGKLAQSFPHGMEDLPNAKWFPGVDRQVQYREGLNVGYRYYDTAEKDVLFPFGHGLSYSKFEFRNLSVQVVSLAGKDIQVLASVEIENVGIVEAAEVAQCYIHDIESSVYRPHHELKGFEKVSLKPQQKQTVIFALDTRAFSFWDTGSQKWCLEAGDFEVQIGSSSKNIRLRHTLTLDCDKTSAEARQSHPPVPLPLTTLNDTDDHFKAMISRNIPPTHIATSIHHNSLLGDTQHTFLGRIIKSTALRMMLINEVDPPEEHVKFSDELLNNSPLRSLVLFSRGDMRYSLLDVIIHIMNGDLLVVLWKLPLALFSLVFEKLFVRRNRV